MSVKTFVNYEIIGMPETSADCFIQVHGLKKPEIMALGARRCEAVSLQIKIGSLRYDLGFIPTYAYWDVVPLIERAFKAGMERGRIFGYNDGFNSASELPK